MAWRRRAVRRGPAYLRMLGGIVIFYALVIVLDDSTTGGSGRVLVLGYLLWNALRLRGPNRLGIWVWAGTAIGFGVVVGFSLGNEPRATSAIVGALSFLIICVVIATIALTVKSVGRVDIEVVLGVLCIYLLLAMLFASLNQFFAAFDPQGYLNGVVGQPTASDLLYFSVITIATVGYGDLSPVSEVARAVSVVEALVGQLYLVSVVAAVVGGWRRGGPDRDPPPDPR